MTRYRDYVERLPTPPWLLGKWGRRWLYMTGLVFDALVEATRQAVKARFPTVAPDDAIPLIGKDRVLEPGLGEDLDTLRARIIGAWEAWSWAGTEKGLIDQLKAWLPSADWALVANREWSVPPAGRAASPDWDPGHGKPGDPDYRPSRGYAAIAGDEWWSRMWVICQTDRWQSDGLWGDPGVWDDGGTWDSTAYPFEVEACKRITQLWKAGHEYVPEILLLLGDSELWDFPEGTWDDPGVWGQGTVVRWHIA